MTVTYTVGDTRDIIAQIPDGTVDLIASSPPFLALRSYLPADHASKGDEIGSEANPAAFIDMLLGLTAEWGRVLAPHGSIAIELGDTYSGSGGGGGDYSADGLRAGQPVFDGSGKRKRETRREGYIVNGIEPPARREVTDAWPRAKSLALIPQLYATALAYGLNPLTGQPSPAGRWLVRNVIVWHRPNPAVGALGDKFRPSTSYIVVATRSAKRWFDLTAVRTQAQDERPRNTNGPKSDAANADVQSKWDERIGSNPAGAPPLDTWTDPHDNHDTWTLTTQPSRLAHYAMWPAKLAERLVLSMCPLAVCRVCGEPRRRIEDRTPMCDGERSNGDVMGRSARGAGRIIYDHERTRATFSVDIETLGWTDCGCAECSRCDGDGLIPNFGKSSDEIVRRVCPDCALVPRFRPGVVLDPFAGSGTTLAVADLHGRDAIGIDINEANYRIYPERYKEVSRALFDTQPEMPGQLGMEFA